MKKVLLISLLILFNIGSYATENVIKIVVLGSSTAAGTGASPSSLAWVPKYTAYIKNINSKNQVINLAKGGYTTYDIMPNGNSVSGRPSPDTDRNITKALSYSPDVIIINMPSNDVSKGYSVSEVMDNYATLQSAAGDIPVYFTTTQPRNFSSNGPGQLQIDIKNETIQNYPDNYIDFWTGIADTDGRIKTEYNSGDGVHLNNAGHEILYNRVISVSSILTYAKSYSAPTYSATGRILIDFGNTATAMASTTDNNWNHVTNRNPGTPVILQNKIGETTPFSIDVHAKFAAINAGGTKTSTTYPENATMDSFYGYTTGQFTTFDRTDNSGVTLSNLDTDKSYSFTFYASRADNTAPDDYRETKYTVTGKTEEEVTLNVIRNVNNTVTVQDMVPDEDGNIVIEVTAGDNNDNEYKFYYLGVLDIAYKPKTASVTQQGRILIDFGKSGTPTASVADNYWNNITDVNDTDPHVLQNKTGETTAFELTVHAPFVTSNNYGPTDFTAYPANATLDAFYGYTTGSFQGLPKYEKAGLTLSNLDADKSYSFTFFASRIQSASDNRETKYTVKGLTEKSANLEILNNYVNTVTIADIEPDENGNIIIEASPSENNTNANKFYYMGIVDIEYKPKTTPVILFDYSLIKNIDYVSLNWKTSSEQRNSHFEIFRAGSDRNFILLSSVPASSYTGYNAYSYKDYNPLNGDNYYFLRQVDLDGAYKDYGVKSANFSLRNTKEISAYISGDNNNIIVCTDSENDGEKAEINIFSAEGRLLTGKETVLKKGKNVIEAGIADAPGVYVVVLKKNNRTFSCKVLKNL